MTSAQHKKFIVIDGLIGAGKTTLIRLLTDKYRAQGLRVCPIFEPVDLWRETGALAHFYENIDQRAYEFQTFAYITRIKAVLDALEREPDADIYLMERSIYTDRHIFVETLRETFGPVRMTMYETWCDMWSRLLPMQISSWVYLNTGLEEAGRRICIRDRTEESGVSSDYQRKLQLAHERFYEDLQQTGKNVIIIEPELMNADFIKNTDVLNTIADRILISAPLKEKLVMLSQ